MQLDRMRVDANSLDKRIDGLVRLFIEQEIETGEIGPRQGTRLLNHLTDVDTRGKPAKREKQREREQPPEFDFHRRSRRSGQTGDLHVGS